jgi:hypothetical protein
VFSSFLKGAIVRHLRAFWFALLLLPFVIAQRDAVALQDQIAGVAPVAIRIPQALVNTSIEPLQIFDGRPEDPNSNWAVGWYEAFGPLADSGNSVFYGLPDFFKAGPGVFWFVENLVAGDSIDVTGADGLVYPYVISSVTTYERTTAPIGEIFNDTGEEMLTLFSAVPPYDEQTDSYLGLLVIRAVPNGEPVPQLESDTTLANDASCALHPQELEINGRFLAPVPSDSDTRRQLTLTSAVPARAEDIASIEQTLQAATPCLVAVREALMLTDGRIVALVGPPGMIPLEELVSPGGFDSLDTAPQARSLVYVLFAPGTEGWTAQGTPW